MKMASISEEQRLQAREAALNRAMERSKERARSGKSTPLVSSISTPLGSAANFRSQSMSPSRGSQFSVPVSKWSEQARHHLTHSEHKNVVSWDPRPAGMHSEDALFSMATGSSLQHAAAVQQSGGYLARQYSEVLKVSEKPPILASPPNLKERRQDASPPGSPEYFHALSLLGGRAPLLPASQLPYFEAHESISPFQSNPVTAMRQPFMSSQPAQPPFHAGHGLHGVSTQGLSCIPQRQDTSLAYGSSAPHVPSAALLHRNNNLARNTSVSRDDSTFVRNSSAMAPFSRDFGLPNQNNSGFFLPTTREKNVMPDLIEQSSRQHQGGEDRNLQTHVQQQQPPPTAGGKREGSLGGLRLDSKFSFVSKDDEQLLLRQEYTSVFKRIDVNKDGFISQIEFMTALRNDPDLAYKLGLPHFIYQKEETRRLFQMTFHEVDANRSKTISLDEWLFFYCPPPEEEAHARSGATAKQDDGGKAWKASLLPVPSLENGNSGNAVEIVRAASGPARLGNVERRGEREQTLPLKSMRDKNGVNSGEHDGAMRHLELGAFGNAPTRGSGAGTVSKIRVGGAGLDSVNGTYLASTGSPNCFQQPGATNEIVFLHADGRGASEWIICDSRRRDGDHNVSHQPLVFYSCRASSSNPTHPPQDGWQVDKWGVYPTPTLSLQWGPPGDGGHGATCHSSSPDPYAHERSKSKHVRHGHQDDRHSPALHAVDARQEEVCL